MAEFTEVMKQRKRIHERFVDTTCDDCPISSEKNGHDIPCNFFVVTYPQEAEEIIMKWAEEHKIKTNADKFKEVFGILPEVDSCAFCNSMYCKIPDDGACNSTCKMYDFWKNEYIKPDKEKENE